ncbi:MAG: alpha/beta fold hydrolase [Bacteroidota bacterium]
MVEVESKQFKTNLKLKIEGKSGFLEVPENRLNPSSRKIRLKFVYLKSLAENPTAPVVFLEGGGGRSTWQAESKSDLSDWMEILEVADLIFLDRRGSSDESLRYTWSQKIPHDFFLSEESANAHYRTMAKAALQKFAASKVDISGYNVIEHAHDVNDLMNELAIDKYSIFGFSFGSHIGMTVMKLFPDRIEKSILAGADGLDQAFNYPHYLDTYVNKLGIMIQQDASIRAKIPNFSELVHRVMKKLDENPALVTIKNPLTKAEEEMAIGSFGLGLILRLDIDDKNDIPVIPRLVHSIDRGDYSLLTWFVQKRVVMGLGIPGAGINQQLASGASVERWQTIQQEADKSPFGNVVNFPFSAVKDHWIANELAIDLSRPLETEIPTLFVTGTLDCRTPIEQVDETMQTFSGARHLKVENAGHEQAMWDVEVFDEAIPRFLLNQKIEKENTYYSDIKFIPLEGRAKGHPSLK